MDIPETRAAPAGVVELTLRDYFAARVLRALLTSDIRGFSAPSLSHPDAYREYALEAYRMADAMMAVRSLETLPPKP